MWDIWGEIFPIPDTPFLFNHTKESIKEDEQEKNRKRHGNCKKSSTENRDWQSLWRKSLLLDKIEQEKKLLAKGTEIEGNQGPHPSIHKAAQSEPSLSKCKSPVPMKFKFKKKSDIAKSKPSLADSYAQFVGGKFTLPMYLYLNRNEKCFMNHIIIYRTNG